MIHLSLSVSAEYRRQVGDFRSVISNDIAQSLGQQASPGQIFDISSVVRDADQASRERQVTYRMAS